MTQQFKKGDRVKVEFEGEVQFADAHAVDIKVDGRVETVYAKSVTLLERPVEPLAPGSVVRGRVGGTWIVGRSGVTYVMPDGTPCPAMYSASQLAERVRDGHVTLLHDGSATT